MVTFGRVFRSLDCALRRRMDQALSGMDLTFSQGHIMGYLAHCDTPPCAKDIEDRFHLSHPPYLGCCPVWKRRNSSPCGRIPTTGGENWFTFCPKAGSAMRPWPP